MPVKETQVRSPVGKIPHAMEQLSLCVTELLSQCSRMGELQLLKPVLPRVCAPQQEKPLQGEARALQPESGPLLLQLEKSPGAATKTHHSQK